MEKVDIVIIGAGVVGLAVAEILSRRERSIVLVEKYDSFGNEASSRNSEVIHAGLYYPSDSLKAKFCLRGNRMLYDLCEQYGIPCRKTGKMVVGNLDEELEKVNSVYEQAKENGVLNLQLINESKIAKMEPNIVAKLGLFSPDTGIIDSHRLMQFYESQAESNDVTIAYMCEVISLCRENDDYTIGIKDSDGESFSLKSDIVINCAGISSDRVASMVGIDVKSAEYKIYMCKGEYYSVSNRHAGKIKRLIYPVPDEVSLGAHIVMKLDGSISLGPSADYINTIDYDVDEKYKSEFFSNARSFLPFLEIDDLLPDMAGIRAKLQSEDGDFRDFVIKEESSKGFPGFINLIGIDSPGLTSTPAVAEYVDKIVSDL